MSPPSPVCCLQVILVLQVVKAAAGERAWTGGAAFPSAQAQGVLR